MKNKSSRYKIIRVVLIVMFLLFVITLSYTSIVLQRFVVVNNQAFIEETANHQANIFNLKINEQLELLKRLEMQFTIIDFDNYNMVKEAICSNRNVGMFDTISIVDKNGAVLCNNNTMTDNISKDKYYKRAMDGETVISDGLITNAAGEKILSMYVPVYQEEKVCGVLLGTFDTGVLSSLFDMKIFDGEGYSFLVNSDGKVIVSSNNENILLEGDNIIDFLKNNGETEDEAFSILEKNIKNNVAGNLEYSVNKNSRYASYQPVGIYNWHVITVVTDDNISAQSKEIGAMIYVLLSIVIIILVGALLLIMGVRKREQKYIVDELNLKEDIERLNEIISEEAYIKGKDEDLDGLTKVINKSNFALCVQRYFQEKKNQSCSAFFLMDIADFANVNSTIGHSGGDYILTKVANKLLRIFNEKDYIGRVGGDKFAVLMIVDENFDCEQLVELAKKKAENIRKSIQEITYEKDNNIGFLNISIGIAISPNDGETYVKLYGNADAALEYVKQSNKGSYAFSKTEGVN